MTQPRASLLVTSVGAINVLIGLVFVGFGIYVILAGADAVMTLFQLQTESGKAADFIAGKDNAQEAKDAAGFFTKGLGGIILAFALVIAGCSIVQGLPNLLVGVGVLLRWNVARVFAIVFAVLAVLEGVACLAAIGQSSRFLYAGLFLLFYAVLTFVGLLSRRASLEFSGGSRQADESPAEKSGPMSMPETTTAPRRPMEVVLLVIALRMTATTAIFATLYFTRGTPLNPLAENANVQPKAARNGAPTAIDDTNTMARHQPKLAAFHEAALAGQIPRAAEILKTVDVDEPDEHGRTALMKVSAMGKVRMAMFLAAMGAQFNQRDKEGKTALMHAIEKNQVGVIGVFVNNGSTMQGEVAALHAQYSNAAKSDKFRLPSLEYNMRDNRGQTAFMQAIVKGHLEAAEKIRFWSNADDLEDADGNSMMHLLAADGNLSLIRRFEWKADVKPPCWYFRTPEGAIGFRCFELNQCNRAGRTPWMIAAEKGHLDIVKHLLSGPRNVPPPKGAGQPSPPVDDLHLKDKSGKTGLDLANANGHKEVAAYLMSLEKAKNVNP